MPNVADVDVKSPVSIVYPERVPVSISTPELVNVVIIKFPVSPVCVGFVIPVIAKLLKIPGAISDPVPSRDTVTLLAV